MKGWIEVQGVTDEVKSLINTAHISGVSPNDAGAHIIMVHGSGPVVKESMEEVARLISKSFDVI